MTISLAALITSSTLGCACLNDSLLIITQNSPKNMETENGEIEYEKFTFPQTTVFREKMEENLLGILGLDGLEDFSETGRLPAEFFSRMRSMMENYDKLRETAIQLSGYTTVCKEGCSACCVLLPSGLYRSELIILYDSLDGEARNSGSGAYTVMMQHLQNAQTIRDLLAKKMPAGTERVEMTLQSEFFGCIAEEYINLRRECGFLNKNGSCSAYQARPITCRMHYRLDDPKYCDPSNHRGKGKMEIQPSDDIDTLLGRIDKKFGLKITPILPMGMVDLANLLEGRKIEKV